MYFHSLLQSDYRHDRYHLEILRQRYAELERKNTGYLEDLETSRERARALQEQLDSQKQSNGDSQIVQDVELKRLKKQFESQTKLLEETEALLETLRLGDSTRLSRQNNNDNTVYLDRISKLEEHIASLTQERTEITGEIQKLQAAHVTIQGQCNKIAETSSQLQAENGDLLKQISVLEAKENNLTESRNEFRNRLNLELQNSKAVEQAFTRQREDLHRQLNDVTALKNQLEQVLQQTQQELAAAQSDSQNNSQLHNSLVEKLKALEGWSFIELPTLLLTI
jgi:chromosome segregation ATPase